MDTIVLAILDLIMKHFERNMSEMESSFNSDFYGKPEDNGEAALIR